MINHFRTYLLNRPVKFFASSILPMHTEPSFVPSAGSKITRLMDTVFFGDAADASLLDYRFAEFLRLINACGLYEHVLRFDRRETYRLDDFYLNDASLFVSSVLPEAGVSLCTLSETPPDVDLPLRKQVLLSGTRQKPSVIDMQTLRPIAYRFSGSGEITLPSLDTGVRGLPDNSFAFELDIRHPPKRTIAKIIDSALSLGQESYFELFSPLRESYPEYENGFRHVTDTVHKFCMMLFAQAIVLEQRKDEINYV